MNLMAAYSDTEVKQATLMSRLSGRPARVQNDVFIWNGALVDRASAVVAFLKIYNQVPVSTAAKAKLHSLYTEKFADNDPSLTIIEDTDRSEIWFYKLCKIIKGDVAERSNEDIKQILISLHQG